MNVYRTSTAPASTQVNSPTGPKLPLNDPKHATAVRPAAMPPTSWDTQYMAIVDAFMPPFMKRASDTAGLKFAPDTDASAKIATINDDAMERTAHVPLPVRTLHPTVRTRRYVPMNSEMQSLISLLTIVYTLRRVQLFSVDSVDRA